jgi:hypothetical protein
MMKVLLTSAVLAFAAMAPTSRAQSKFDGTWKVDFESAMPTKVNVWLLQNGIYKCLSCTPIIEVKADGTDRPVNGQPFDTISVAILDRQTVREVEKKNGEIVSDEKLAVSANGNTVTDEFANWKLTMTKVEQAPAGTHALSGSWKPVQIESISDRELLVTYQLVGDTFSMSRPTGQSYTAKLNGPDAPYKGDLEIDAVALKRVNNDVIEETDMLRGKPVSVTRISVDVDGKFMTVSSKNLPEGSNNQFKMKKQ